MAKRKVKFFYYWQAKEMNKAGLTASQIAKELEIEEWEVRNYLKPMNAKVE